MISINCDEYITNSVSFIEYRDTLIKQIYIDDYIDNSISFNGSII